MKELFRVIGRLAGSDLTVLLIGESGTGKERIARALHETSRRADKPFVALNVAAIPGELLESELFGHEKGAFSGADEARAGYFEQAAGGTLFLDEIGDMPAALQTRLLRVLADGDFHRLGGRTAMRADVRLIAATNQDLARAVAEGRFREDLYHRLNVVELILPPLREVEATHGRLSDSLGLTGWARFRIVTLPRLRRPLGFAAGLTAALSMGDLGVIVLFAEPDGATLPLMLYRLMGAYRLDNAAGAAVLLLGASLLMFWVFDRWGRGHAAV
jgi:transcriptional regulator of aromatic amino acid metabolism